MTQDRAVPAARQVLEHLYAAYNQRDAEAAAELYAVDGEHEDIPAGQVKRGRGAIADGLRYFFKTFPDAHWTVSNQLSDGDWAVGCYALSGTLQSDLGRFRAVSQPLELRGVHVLQTSTGLITRSEDFWDSATFQRQMSITPTDQTFTTETGEKA